MHRNKVIGVAAVVVIVAVAATACSNNESTETTTTRAETTTTAKRESFQVSTPEGQASLSLDGQLPPGWPANFPVPDNAEPAGSGSVSGSTSGYLIGVYTTSESGKDVFDFYNSQTALQPTDQRSAGGSNFLGSMKIASPDSGSITISEVSGTTYIVVFLTTAGTSTSTTGAGSASSSTSSSSSSSTTTAGG